MCVQVAVGGAIFDVGRKHRHVQGVDSLEFFLLRLGRTRHTGQFIVHAEIVLKCDGSVGQALTTYLHALLGFYSLVQPLGEAPPVHEATGELVYDDHLSISDNVFLVPLVGDQCPQRVIEVGQHMSVLRVIEALTRLKLRQRPLNTLHSLLRQCDNSRPFLQYVIPIRLILLDALGAAGPQPRHDSSKAAVKL